MPPVTLDIDEIALLETPVGMTGAIGGGTGDDELFEYLVGIAVLLQGSDPTP